MLGLRDISVFELHCHVPQPRDDLAQRVVALCVLEIVIDRAQAKIDAGLRRKSFRRDRQRIEGGKHQRFGFRVQRENASLLDQRARERLHKNTLGQLQFVRLTAALIAGFVA